jgi:hypothetical protein
MKAYTYTGTNKVFLPGHGVVMPGQTIKTEKKIRNSQFREVEIEVEQEKTKSAKNSKGSK